MKFVRDHGLYLGPLVLFLFVLGIHHHFLFSLEMGEWTYFKNAYDEDTYMIWYDEMKLSHFRFLSAGLYHFLLYFFGKNLVTTIADTISPIVLGTGFYFISWRFLKNRTLSVISALLFVTAPDLFGFQNVTIFEKYNISNLLSNSSWLRGYIPEAKTTYFGFLRNFEPVTSWIYYTILFLLVFNNGCLKKGEFFSSSSKWKVAIYTMLIFSATTYAFIYLGFVVFLILWTTISLIVGLRRECKSTAFALFVCVLSFLLFKQLDTQYGGGKMTYSSRLPFLSISFLYLCVWLGVVWLKKNLFRAQIYFSLALVLVPWVVLNQQVITGVLVSVRDWEKYVAHFFPFFGLIILFGRQKKCEVHKPVLHKVSQVGCILLLCVLLFSASKDSYKRWLPSNRTAHVYRGLIKSSLNSNQKNRFVLENPKLSPNLRWTLGLSADRFAIDYTELFEKRIATVEGSIAKIKNQSYFKKKLWNYFASTGRSPEEVSVLLKKQLNRRAGYELHFLFSFHDVWYPISDRRYPVDQRIVLLLEELISDFEQFSSNYEVSESWVYVSDDEFKEL